MQRVLNKKTLKLLCFLAVMQAIHVHGAGLNDTGVVNVDAAAPNGQDAQIGRDAAAAAGVLPKIGSGSKGFDFTKIANNGSSLPANTALGTTPGDWACTPDNVTSLTWEVKTDDDGLRDKDWTYTWFSSDNTSNGDNQGTANGGTCFDTVNCDTEKYASAVNALNPALCGYDDWRMPTREELRSIVDYGKTLDPAIDTPAIDTNFFPNTLLGIMEFFWSASAFASLSDADVAWGVGFNTGGGFAGDGIEFKNGFGRVRLVRALPISSISAPNCTIPAGESSCSTLVTWSSSNTTAPTSMRQNGAEFSIAANNTTGTTRTLTFAASPHIFKFFHNSPATELASVSATASCAPGTSWNESFCAATTGFSCTGITPGHATIYPGDDTGLTANTPKTFSPTNTPPKCQYGCNGGFSWCERLLECRFECDIGDF